MAGISSSVGLFSGINTEELISQLIAVESRPKLLAQQRITQLQGLQAAYLDINSKLASLQSAATAFRTKSTFRTKGVTSSNENVLSATASFAAAEGSHTFLVDRLVSTQQRLSRGFASSNAASLGLTSMVFESARARVDRDASLAELNNGAGVARGKILVTDSGGRTATVDLSRTTSVNEVLDAINANGTALVTASVEGGRFVVRDNAGGNITIANGLGSTTATSLGIAGTATGTLSGQAVFQLNANTAISRLNDGNGVRINTTVSVGNASVFDFKLVVDNGGGAKEILVNLGDVYEDVNGTNTKVQGAVTTVGGVIERINAAIAQAATTDAFVGTVSASLDPATGGLRITDSTGLLTLSTVEKDGQDTAADLGILTSTPATGTIVGRRVLAGLNSVLTSNINGGQGFAGDGLVKITTRDGTVSNINLTDTGSLADLMRQLEAGTGNRVRVSLNENGNGLRVEDVTGGSASNLIIVGTDGVDSAASLGISTGATGVAQSSVGGQNVQRRYVTRSTLLSNLPTGGPIGTGQIRITDSDGAADEVTIDNGVETVGELLDAINSRGLRIIARVNANGDGIEIVEDTSTLPAGAVKIKVEDLSGIVGQRLNLKGEASGLDASNTINASFERVVAFSAADTLDAVVSKINAANVGLQAAVVNDGSGGNAYRLSLAARSSGAAGRVLVDSGGFDFGFQLLDRGEDARLFYGSTDAARAIAITTSSNQFDAIVPGLKINAKSRSDDAVTLSVTRDAESIEAGVTEFVDAFNALAGRIGELTKYDAEAQRGGALLGESLAIDLRNNLYAAVQAPARGLTGPFRRLSDVGITIGKGGRLELNTDKLRAALDRDATAVEDLFAAQVAVDDATVELFEGVTARNPNAGSTFSSLGVMGIIDQLGKKYLDGVNGILTRRGRGLDDQIKLQNERISLMDVKIERKREILQRQFAAMESTLARLQSQGNALGSLGAARR